MREGNDALDSLFGPYDFLESQLSEPPHVGRDQRMSQSPEDRSAGASSSRSRGGGLDVLATFPDAPGRSAGFIPVDDSKPSSDGSTTPLSLSVHRMTKLRPVTKSLTFGSFTPGSPTRQRVSVITYTMFMMTQFITIVCPEIHWSRTFSSPDGYAHS